MNWFPLWLADADPADIMAGARGFSDPAKREVAIFLFALGGCVLVVLLWAMFLRKPGGRRHRHRHHHEHGPERQNETADKGSAEKVNTSEDENEAEEEMTGRRGRRKRRKHRPLNPTLAETGGLPPRRTDPASTSPPA